MGIIAVILWVIILTIFLISALNEVGLASVIGPAVVAILLVFIGLVVYQFAFLSFVTHIVLYIALL